MNYYIGNKDHPQHVSVGAVMHDGQGRIRAHHFPEHLAKGFWQSIGITNFYILMRSTVEPNETLEHALERGLLEEFNATATIDDYLGSIVSTAYDPSDSGGKGPFQKTTLYFRCSYTGEGPSRRDMSDAEGQSELEWKSTEELIPIMREQGRKFGRDDVDESPILERFLAQQS